MPNFYYKTDVACDGLEIIIDQNTAGSPQVIAESISAGSPAVIVTPEYVPGSNNIEVFEQESASSPEIWTAISTDDYTETSSTSITLDETTSNVIKVVRKVGRLVEDVHYIRINSRIIQFIGDYISDIIPHIVKVYTINPGKFKLNPAKIIDDLAGTVITNVPVWDPGRGHQFHRAIHVIDLERGDPLNPQGADPALYNDTDREGLVSSQPWEKGQVGTTWFDTSTIGYIPYYDDKVFPLLNDRLFYWGALASWADANFYQWTESDVPAAEYDAVAATQEGDVTIDETIRVTGTAKATLYQRTRDTFPFTATVETQGISTITLSNLYGTTAESDLTGLGNNFSESFVHNGSGAAETFTLTLGFYVGSSNLRVTVNGVVVTPTFDSPTSFTVGGGDLAAAPDTVLATITAPVYSSEITVDGGVAQPIIVNGSTVQTFGQLIEQVNDDLSGVSAVLNGNEIIITSDSTGSTSIVAITEGGSPLDPLNLFENLINFTSISAVNGVDTEATAVGNPFIAGDEVIVSSDGTLPTPLEPGTYTVNNVSGGSPDLNTFQLEDDDGILIVYTDTGIGTHNIVASVWNTDWEQESSVHEVFDVAYEGKEGTTGPIILNKTATSFGIGDLVDVYVNEFFVESLTVTGSGSPAVPAITLTSQVLQLQDTVRVIRPAHEATDEELGFDPDIEDDGTTLVQYKNFYDYTERTVTDINGFTSTLYYFWVGNKTVRTLPNSALTLREGVTQLITIPIPYIIYQNLKPQSIAPKSLANDPLTRLPNRYDQIILRGHTGLINADNRYLLRFTRDNTLRDRLENADPDSAKLKNTHVEWEIFRESQQFNITRDLWDKVTEAMAGYTLADTSVRVPARERELYDETYGTDTQYGLGEGQIFLDGETALADILADLTDPDNDFTPTDIAVFFDNFAFDTPDNRVIAMDYIYNNFSFENVNRMFFSVLLDAFVVKSKYPEIFKTSMVSLHGIRILETAGVFDD